MDSLTIYNTNLNNLLFLGIGDEWMNEWWNLYILTFNIVSSCFQDMVDDNYMKLSRGGL